MSCGVKHLQSSPTQLRLVTQLCRLSRAEQASGRASPVLATVIDWVISHVSRGMIFSKEWRYGKHLFIYFFMLVLLSCLVDLSLCGTTVERNTPRCSFWIPEVAACLQVPVWRCNISICPVNYFHYMLNNLRKRRACSGFRLIIPSYCLKDFKIQIHTCSA